MIVSRRVVCVTCRVPFTRSSAAARSSDFYRTREENDQCICCREGIDPDTLLPLARKDPIMKPAHNMSDEELGAAILELAAPRVRMAPLEDLRKVADTLATLAVEAAGRLKDRRGELVDVGAAGRRVLEAIAAGDPTYGG